MGAAACQSAKRLKKKKKLDGYIPSLAALRAAGVRGVALIVGSAREAVAARLPSFGRMRQLLDGRLGPMASSSFSASSSSSNDGGGGQGLGAGADSRGRGVGAAGSPLLGVGSGGGWGRGMSMAGSKALTGLVGFFGGGGM
jgi:hypothetical protein